MGSNFSHNNFTAQNLKDVTFEKFATNVTAELMFLAQIVYAHFSAPMFHKNILYESHNAI